MKPFSHKRSLKKRSEFISLLGIYVFSLTVLLDFILSNRVTCFAHLLKRLGSDMAKYQI